MKSLIFTCFLYITLSLIPESLQYASAHHQSEPTATLSLVRDPEDPSNRYSLQVSTDQINHYLKTLSNVPSSIYDSAHIITDFDESTLSNAYSRPSETSNQQDNNKYAIEEPTSSGQLEKANLYHESHYGSESNLYPKKQMIKLFDELDLGQGRITANPKAVRRIYYGNREYIIRKDEPTQLKESVKQSTGDESPKIASASARIAAISEGKSPSIEIGQKPASNEYPPSVPSTRGQSSFGIPRDLVSKEKSEADLEREKEEQAAMEKVQDDLMKELYAIQKQQQQQQSNEANNKEIEAASSSKEPISQSSLSAKNEVDLKTVQTLLTTLIRQIEQIQAVAKNLPIGGQGPAASDDHHIKEVPSKPYKEAVNIDVPTHHEIRGKQIAWTPENRKKYNKKQKVQDEHQEVFLKAPDLVKLLTGESYDPEYLPVSASQTVTRRIVPMPMSMPSYHIQRSAPAYPFAYSIPFSNYPVASFYPGFKK